MVSKRKLVSWSDTFSVGVELIDEQHKGLLDMVNNMHSHAAGNQTAELAYLKSIIDKMISYVKIHFATEEKIMMAAKYSGYAEHKKVHEGFIHAVAEAFNGFISGKRLSLFTFTKFLKNWVFSHIAVMDKHYFEYLRRIATRKDNGKLSITLADVQAVVSNRKPNAPQKMKVS